MSAFVPPFNLSVVLEGPYRAIGKATCTSNPTLLKCKLQVSNEVLQGSI